MCGLLGTWHEMQAGFRRMDTFVVLFGSVTEHTSTMTAALIRAMVDLQEIFK